jgi:hypothetical protein
VHPDRRDPLHPDDAVLALAVLQHHPDAVGGHHLTGEPVPVDEDLDAVTGFVSAAQRCADRVLHRRVERAHNSAPAVCSHRSHEIWRPVFPSETGLSDQCRKSPKIRGTV